MSTQVLPAQAKPLFHYLFEQASLGIAVEDLEGNLLLANPALCAMLGYEANELCGMSCSQFSNPEDAQDDWALFQRLRAGEVSQYSVEKRYIRKDGTRIWGQLNVSILKGAEGDPPLVFAFLEDISARKRTEEALRESEQRFRRAASAGKMFAYEWDAATDVLVKSGECAEILGTEPVSNVTSGREVLAKVHPDDREKLQAADAALRPESPNLKVSHRMVRPDGKLIWMERTGRAHFDEQGKLLRVVGMVADITERMEGEEALRRSESKYRLFVSQSSEGIFCQELDRPIPVHLPEDEQVHRILHESYMGECNEGLARMYGMTPSDFSGMRLTQTLDASDPVNIELTREYIRAGYRVVDRESHEVDPEGNPRVFQNSMIGIVENGMLVRTWGIQRDITERRRAEEERVCAEQALRESEQRFRLAIQAGKMYAFEWDVATDAVSRSEEHRTVLGFSDPAGPLTRRQALARIHPDEQARAVSSNDLMTPENPNTHVTYRMVRPDGSAIWLEKSARASFDEQGKILKVIGIVADITERKRAEETLHESERNLADAQARAHLGSWVETCTDHKLSWSDELYRLWGFEPRSVEPSWAIFLGGIHPEDWPHVQRSMEASLKSLRPFDCVHRVIRPDGSLRFAHTQGEPITNDQGQVVRLVGTVLDITEQKLAENALSGVTRRLFEAQEQERARIARELHDDINQRLAMLTIHLGQVQEDYSDLPTELIHRLGNLKKESAEISKDIQSLSHELHLAKLEYLGITTAVKAFCKEFGDQQRVEIDFEVQDVPVDLSPDAALCLFRVLQESLHNSVKHSGVGHFEVRLREIAGEVHLTVRDSGAGFDTKAAKQGRGLGLVSMEERLKLVNGMLSIESRPQGGTTIHARVPIRRASDAMQVAG